MTLDRALWLALDGLRLAEHVAAIEGDSPEQISELEAARALLGELRDLIRSQ